MDALKAISDLQLGSRPQAILNIRPPSILDYIARHGPQTEQNAIKILKYNPQGFKITINENPPMVNFFVNKFWFPQPGIEPRAFGLEV